MLRVAVTAGAASAVGTQALHVPDTSSYLEPAQALLAEGTFTRAGHPEVVRTPGYPLLLVPGLAVGHLEAVTVALQAVLGGATVLAVFGLAHGLFGLRAAAAAAGLCALEPLSVLYTGKLLTETLFAACFIGALLFLLRFQSPSDPRRLRHAVFAGALLGAAALTRPIAYPLALVVVAVLAWRALRRPRPPEARPVALLVFALLAIGPPLAWQARNYVRADYTRLSAIVDVNSYFYHGAATQAAAEGLSFYALQRELGYHDLDIYLARHPEQRAWTPAQRFTWMGRTGLTMVLENPATALGVYLRGLLRVALDPGGIEYWKLFGAYPAEGSGLLGRIVDQGLWATLRQVVVQRPGLVLTELVCGLLLLALYALAARGVTCVGPEARVAAATCLVAAGLLFLAAGGPHSLSRFRHPIMPIVCVFAGPGLAASVRRARNMVPPSVFAFTRPRPN